MDSVWRKTVAILASALVLASVQPAAAAPESALASALRAKLAPASDRDILPCAGEMLLRPAEVRAFYRLRGFNPYWQVENRLHRDTEAILELLRDADKEGLQPADYHVDALGRVFAGRATLIDEEPAVTAPLRADLELLLTDAILCFGADVAHGRIDGESIYEKWRNPARDFDPVLALTGVLTAGGSPRTALAALRPPHPEYRQLLSSLARYRAIRDSGGWSTIPDGATLRPGERDPRVPRLRQRLRVTDDLPSEPLVYELPGRQPPGIPLIVVGKPDPTAAAAPTDATLYDERLVEATERFQARHGLEEDGVIGPRTLAALNVPVEERIELIALNLERLRWLPRDLGERYIRINIPELRLQVIEENRTMLSMRTIVGRTERPTPVFTGKLTYLEFNPYWTIPRTLAEEDLLPRIKRDPGYLVDRSIRVFSNWSREAPEVDPYSIDWAGIDPEDLPYKLRQEPGPRNPLGRAKFMFPNEFEVYIHDTTSRARFRRASRYYSSGCIRIEDPIALADYLLNGRKDWDSELLQETLASRENKTVGVHRAIPVHLLYLSSWVSADGLVNFRDDVYSYDTLLQDALAVRGAALTADRIASLAAGDDAARVNATAVARTDAGETATESHDRGPASATPTVDTVGAAPRAGNLPDGE